MGQQFSAFLFGKPMLGFSGLTPFLASSIHHTVFQSDCLFSQIQHTLVLFLCNRLHSWISHHRVNILVLTWGKCNFTKSLALRLTLVKIYTGSIIYSALWGSSFLAFLCGKPMLGFSGLILFLASSIDLVVFQSDCLFSQIQHTLVLFLWPQYQARSTDRKVQFI